MRRFQVSSTMTSKPSKSGYDPVSRSTLLPTSAPTKSRLIKAVATLLTFLIGLSFFHTLLSPRPTLFGLMIDAGSTGSRIHTYAFTPSSKHSNNLHLLNEDFFALKPGLSAHKDDPQAAARSLIPLLERAMTRVPAHARKHTPVVLRATAGLRMIGDQPADAILTHVRKLLAESEFRFDSNDWATILAGNQEAVYSWITVNYLLDRRPGDTVGTLEMGGGSAQVAYVPRDSLNSGSDNCSVADESVPFKGKDLPLYTVSHLDFGLQKARAIALEKFEKDGKLNANPCINKGATVDVAVPFNDEGKKLTMDGTGDFAECKQLVDDAVVSPVMGAPCGCTLCTYRSAAQPPSIPEYVAIAFYLERTVPLGLTSPLTVKDMREKGEEICSMSVDEVQAKYPHVPNGVATDLCFDLTFIILHLERGHGITEDSGTKLMVMNKIKDVELGWCLGAMQQTMSQLGLGR